MHQGKVPRGIERQCPDSTEGEDDGLNILRDAAPDTLTLALVAAACAAAILLIVLLVRGRGGGPQPAAPIDPGEVARVDLAGIVRRLEALEQGVAQVAAALPATVQGVGVVRFNPFPEMTGVMSFSLALLDGRANGVVISVLNDRQGSRVYGKPVEAGASALKLSDEEQQALGLARGRRA